MLLVIVQYYIRSVVDCRSVLWICPVAYAVIVLFVECKVNCVCLLVVHDYRLLFQLMNVDVDSSNLCKCRQLQVSAPYTFPSHGFEIFIEVPSVVRDVAISL